MCEGTDMIVDVSEQFIIDNTSAINGAEDIARFLETKKLKNGDHRISWWGNEDYIGCENFIPEWLKENYDEWVENYEN